MVACYYRDKSNTICGPCSGQQMWELLSAGVICRTTHCREEGKKNWLPLQLQPWFESLGRGPIIYTCPYCSAKQNEGEISPRCPGCGRYQAPAGHGFVDHLLLAFRRILQWKGRSTRMEYWGWWLGKGGVSLLIFLFAGLINPKFAFIFEMALLLLIPFSWTVICRRLHDVGLSGKWCIPWLLIDVALVLFVSVTSVLFATGAVKYSLYHGLGTAVAAVIYLYSLLQIPVSIALLILGCIDSQRGTNQYGTSYKYPRSES